MHASGLDDENCRFAMSLSYTVRGCFVLREMHMPSGLWSKALC